MFKELQLINRKHLLDTSPGLGKRDIHDKDHGYWFENLAVWQLFLDKMTVIRTDTQTKCRLLDLKLRDHFARSIMILLK